MESLLHAIDALEYACESKQSLLEFSPPSISIVIDQLQALPLQDRDMLHSRLDRVGLMMEVQMMLYAEEIEKLKTEIRTVQRTAPAAQAYRRVAVLKPKSETVQ